MQEQMASRHAVRVDTAARSRSGRSSSSDARTSRICCSHDRDTASEMSVREAIGAGRAPDRAPGARRKSCAVDLGGLGGLIVAYARLARRSSQSRQPTCRGWTTSTLDASRARLRRRRFDGLCGLLIGLVPAWRAGSVDLHASLKGRGEGDAHPATIRIRSVLVATEIAPQRRCGRGCCVAVAKLRRTHASATADSTPTKLLTARRQPRRAAVSRLPRSRRHSSTRLSTISGKRASVAAVAVSTQLPLTGTGSLSALSVEGHDGRWRRNVRQQMFGACRRLLPRDVGWRSSQVA